jgi:DNA-binding response OmpR family regulator
MLSQRKILLIDDSPELGEHVREFLEFEGYRVQFALDGETGLHLMKTFLPDAIVVDMVLPGMSGLEVIRQARDQFEALLIVAATGMADDDLRMECIAIGANHFLTKPYRLSVLRRLLAGHLSG